MENINEIHKNYDAVFKESLMLFSNKKLDFAGLDLPVISTPINTEMTELHVNKNFTDMGFMLEDETGLHMEREADISRDDMLRFCTYNINYLRMFKTKFTTVVFTNKPQSITHFENEMIRFTPIVINLGEQDGDELLQKIKRQIENNEPVSELELVYLPLYHSKDKSVAEMLEQVVALAPQIPNDKAEQEKIMVMSVVVANKFLDTNEFSKIWEAIKMYMDDLLVIKFAKADAKKEGIEEGKIEGKIEGKKEGVEKVAKSMLLKGMATEAVAEYTELELSEVENLKQCM